jgi:ribosomal protein S14
MKKMFFKNSYLFNDNKNRNSFRDTEIFFDSCLIVTQAKFSNKLLYFFLKRRQISISFLTKVKNRCLLSGSSRSVISRIKFSRIAFSRKVLDGSMTGFYKAL